MKNLYVYLIILFFMPLLSNCEQKNQKDMKKINFDDLQILTNKLRENISSDRDTNLLHCILTPNLVTLVFNHVVPSEHTIQEPLSLIKYDSTLKNYLREYPKTKQNICVSSYIREIEVNNKLFIPNDIKKLIENIQYYDYYLEDLLLLVTNEERFVSNIYEDPFYLNGLLSYLYANEYKFGGSKLPLLRQISHIICQKNFFFTENEKLKFIETIFASIRVEDYHYLYEDPNTNLHLSNILSLLPKQYIEKFFFENKKVKYIEVIKNSHLIYRCYANIDILRFMHCIVERQDITDILEYYSKVPLRYNFLVYIEYKLGISLRCFENQHQKYAFRNILHNYYENNFETEGFLCSKINKCLRLFDIQLYKKNIQNCLTFVLIFLILFSVILKL